MAQQLQILVVEENPHLSALLVWHLQQMGHRVQTANEIRQAKAVLQSDPIQLLILDDDLSPQEGVRLCNWAYRHWNLLILMLSSRNGDQDVIKALQAGADDYLIKPMSMQVLCARVSVLSRRLFRSLPPTYLRFGPVQIDLVQRRVMVADQEVELTPQEFSLLFVLVQGNGSPLSRTDLLQRAWPDAIDNPRTVDTHILSLRKKLEPDPRHPTLIRTVRNVGYCFDATPEASRTEANPTPVLISSAANGSGSGGSSSVNSLVQRATRASSGRASSPAPSATSPNGNGKARA